MTLRPAKLSHGALHTKKLSRCSRARRRSRSARVSDAQFGTAARRWLNSAERAQVRNRERWAKAGASQPKGAGMQPSEVFAPSGGVVFGGSPAEADGALRLRRIGAAAERAARRP